MTIDVGVPRCAVALVGWGLAIGVPLCRRLGELESSLSINNYQQKGVLSLTGDVPSAWC